MLQLVIASGVNLPHGVFFGDIEVSLKTVNINTQIQPNTQVNSQAPPACKSNLKARLVFQYGRLAALRRRHQSP